MIQVIPQLRVRGAAAAIEFYQRAFGAVEVMRLEEESGRIGYAELRLGDVELALSDEYPEYGAVGPATLGSAGVALGLYVPDADATFAAAITAGATERMPMRDEFYGDRTGSVVDPFGHWWNIATRKEEVSPEEMRRRFKALYG
jgi:PhnB protein